MNYFTNLLRPIFEFRAGAITLFLAVFSFSFKEAILFLPSLGLAVSLFLLLAAANYFRKGIMLYKYHRGLSSTELYTMNSEDVYRSPSAYFAGRGFEWTAEHTKRIRDLYERRNAEFIYPSSFEKKLKNFALVREESPVFSYLYSFLDSSSLWNPYPPRNQTGASAIHGIGMWEGEEDIFMNINATNHILIAGGTGSGKSCALQVLCNQDVMAGRSTILLDPKGGYKLFSAAFDAAVQKGKAAQFKIVHLAFPEHSAQYNALGQYHRITEISGRITQGVDSEENFKQFAWLKSNFIAVGLHYIGEQANFDKIKYYITRCDELVEKYCQAYIDRNSTNSAEAKRVVDRFLKNVQENGRPTGHDPRVVKLGQAVNALINQGVLPESQELQTMLSYLKENVDHERKLVRNIEPILEKLTTGSISQIMVPDYDDLSSDRDILDWSQVLNDGEIVYMGTNALGDTTISSTFIQIVLEDFSNYLGTLYQYGSDYGRVGLSESKGSFLNHGAAIHIDELSAIKTNAVRNLLARVGELGVKVRVYTQDAADLVVAMGGKEEAESAIGNFGALLMFRVNNRNTAELLVSRLPMVGVEKEGRVYGATDSPKPDSSEDFSSSAMQREEISEVPLVSHETIMSLPTGQAFLLTNGSKLEKVRLPLIIVDDNIAPDSVRDMVDVMKNNDASRVSAKSYVDTWFNSNYPEFNSSSTDLLFDEVGVNRTISSGSGTGLFTADDSSMKDVLDTDASTVSSTLEVD